jgi:uncharacterized alkaline shock family protein YloU
MAESREYISRQDELGEINISEEVLAIIAAAAALEVEGVSSLGSGFGSDGVVSKKGLSKGIRLALDDETDQVSVTVAILVEYGHVVPAVAKAVQESIASAVENTSGLKVSAVNVSVTGVHFQK